MNHDVNGNPAVYHAFGTGAGVLDFSGMMLPKKVRSSFAKWDRPDGPGCAVAVYRDGETLFAGGFGAAHLEHGVPISTSTVFHIASIAKMFTAYAVALLARDGELTLDAALRDYLPELDLSVTCSVRQVIHHTSGLRDQWDLLRLAGWRHADLKTNRDILTLAARQRELNFEPGTRFQYINTGYTLLGIAVERITGRSLREFAASRIFGPLEMHDTQYHDDATRIVPRRAQAYGRGADGKPFIDMPAYETVGPTSVLSTVDDFGRWERHFLTCDPELLGMLTSSGSLADGRSTHYGFGLILGRYRDVPVIEHAGGDGGYRAHYLRVPDERLAVAIFANTSDIRPGLMAREVADAMLSFPQESRDAAIPAWAGRAAGIGSPDPADLLARSGNYRDDLSGMTCRIEPRGGRLFMTADAGGEFELVPVSADRYRFLAVDAECVWSDDAMRIYYGGNEQAVCRRVESFDPPRAAPRDYAGRYWSVELDVGYTIANGDDERLWLQRAKFRPSELRPLTADEYTSIDDGLHLRFLRDAGGAVTEMRVTAERVWNVRFTREAEDRA